MKFTTEPIVDIVVSRCKTIATTYPNHEENFVKGGGVQESKQTSIYNKRNCGKGDFVS